MVLIIIIQQRQQHQYQMIRIAARSVRFGVVVVFLGIIFHEVEEIQGTNMNSTNISSSMGIMATRLHSSSTKKPAKMM